MHSRWNSLLLAIVSAVISSQVLAVSVPDAGQTLQENQPKLRVPSDSESNIDLISPQLLNEGEGGMKIVLSSILLEGNSRFSSEVLLAVIGDVFAGEYDLGGLRSIANRLSEYYRSQGYVFAKAYLPAQTLKGGVLRIRIIEGVYGKIEAEGYQSQVVQRHLKHLKPGDVIESGTLERSILLLQDMPGIVVKPIMRPGKQVGEGNLDVSIREGDKVSGSVSGDNQGSRYTGAYRMSGAIATNNLLQLGDDLAASLLLSDQELIFGNIGYSAPVGYDGLRLGLSYVKSDYEIDESVDSSLIGLNAYGIAEVFSVTATYPLIRSQAKNLNLVAEYDVKSFRDVSSGSATRKSANVLPIGINFNWQDTLFGGALTYGEVKFHIGDLNIKSGAALTQDQSSAKTDGAYKKISMDIVRLQNLLPGWILYSHLAGQWANKNLDSSEDMSLGGANAVRAYPSGETSSDKVILGQFELRYQMSVASPFAFYDIAKAWKNTDPWDTSDNDKTVSGLGLGVRGNYEKWSAEVSASWRLSAKPTSDARDNTPRVWASVKRAF